MGEWHIKPKHTLVSNGLSAGSHGLLVPMKPLSVQPFVISLSTRMGTACTQEPKVLV